MACFKRSLAPSRRGGALAALLVSGVVAGCQQAPARPAGTESVVPTYNAETGRLERISYDRNKDGKHDAWLFMDATRVVRAELDENYDGAVDRWEHYGEGARASAAGEVPRGVLERAEQSLRFDGQVSRWETYEGGQLTAVREDADGDGRPDKWETWVAGSLTELALDTRGAGKPDRRLVYPADGSEPQLLVDRAGDGQFTPATSEP